MYHSTTIPIPPCPSIRLADLLTDEEIAWARGGYAVVVGVARDYSEFIRIHLQGCLAGITILLFPSEFKFSFCMFIFHISARVTTFACWIFSLHLLKERKRERKRKRFPLLTMLVALLVLSWRLILIFQHDNMM